MKTKYESPLMVVEMFAANRAIATCKAKNVVFDCTAGGALDTDYVLLESPTCSQICGSTQNATTNVIQATNPLLMQGTGTSNAGTWTGNGQNAVYTASNKDGKSPVGLLYICVEGNKYYTNQWSVSNNVLTHYNKSQTSHSTDGDHFHCQIAPVYDWDSVDTVS